MNSFEEMPVWQNAMDVAVRVFALTAGLPRCEDYGLTSQMRRSSLSISDNLAEGFGRDHLKDKIKFYYYSRGSAFELKNQLIYGYKVKYFEKTESDKMIHDIEGILFELNSLIKAIRKKGLEGENEG
jgi:four helix bundle protein